MKSGMNNFKVRPVLSAPYALENSFPRKHQSIFPSDLSTTNQLRHDVEFRFAIFNMKGVLATKHTLVV